MRDVVTFRNFNSNPFRVLDEVEKDMRRFLNILPTKTWEYPDEFAKPLYDIKDSESHFLLSFDLPGVKKEDVQIEIRNKQLFITGERKNEFKESDYTEKRYGRFERVIPLPQNIEEDKVEAHFEDGVLSVAVPKSEASKPKKITINDGKKEGVWGRLLGSGQKEVA